MTIRDPDAVQTLAHLLLQIEQASDTLHNLTNQIDATTDGGFGDLLMLTVVAQGLAPAMAGARSAFQATQPDLADLSHTDGQITPEGLTIRAHIVAGTSPQVPS